MKPDFRCPSGYRKFFYYITPGSGLRHFEIGGWEPGPQLRDAPANFEIS